MEPVEELRNEDPVIVQKLVQNIAGIFSNFGWYILLVSIAFIYIYNNYLSEYLRKYYERKAEDEYVAKYHKNPDLMQSRILAMEEARKRMQEKHNREAEEFKIKQQLKEEKKRAEWLEKHNSDPIGVKLGRKENIDKHEKKQTLKPGYNPLAGGSGGSSYRAPKRSSCGGGGGCG